MPHIIASTYEISEKIGSGGGGIVYLGKHLRLGKLIVLKADKRTLSTRPEVLHREVDALKNLSHTYIPQVYDFVVEEDTVYTVMDYIEGESLDKPLKRGERFSQAQIIAWTHQLLDALCYLHSRPPHGILHSDIKPANIMLTPQGNICLIDFNIALALGEEGTVRVGFSRGYASPEHYGIDYSSISSQYVNVEKTELLNPETQLKQQSISSTTRKYGVLLDVRSDIYSLGATLYHLLTGIRPAQDAKQVMPITSAPGISATVAEIIQKAMSPDPEQRYQTAAEMLEAFEHLHENDFRTKRHKRRVIAASAVLATTFLLGGLSTFLGLKQMEQNQAQARLLAETAEAALSSISKSETAFSNGDIPTAIEWALDALEKDTVYNAQGQKVLTDALGVYDLADGFKMCRALELSGEPLKLALSPTGRYIAVSTSGKVSVFEAETGLEITQLESNRSALSDVLFLSESTLLYAGPNALCAYDVVQKQELWIGYAATSIAVSEDGSTIAGIYKDENSAAIYDAATGEVLGILDFADKCQQIPANDTFRDTQNNLFALSGDGTWLAVSFADGSLWVYDLDNHGGDIEIYDTSDYTHFEGGFCGNYFAFSATNSEESQFSIIDLENLEEIGSFSSNRLLKVQGTESGILLCSENLLVQLDPETGEQTELAYTGLDISVFAHSDQYTVTSVSDGSYSFFDESAQLLNQGPDGNRADLVQLAGDTAAVACYDVPSVRILRLEQNPEHQIFTYDREYEHSEARLSADKSTVMFFRYDQFCLYDINGTLLAEVDLPDAMQVYDQQYRRDDLGSYLEVLYNSGLIRRYSAVDGSLISETMGEPPDNSIQDEFFTDQWRIVSPLHGVPIVYDRETGEELGTLDPNAYLTYVTQVDNCVIAQYITMTEGNCYGVLLDENLETLAYMPNLCDILSDGTLVFDDMRGNLRQCRIYSTQELIALGENYKGGIP